MLNGMNKILNSPYETTVIVSHATAITYVLMNYCELKDACLAGKRRHLIFNGKTVINDSFSMPEVFKLCFDDNRIISIERVLFK